jgi:hypothetical protein
MPETTATSPTKVKGYKGFDEKLRCNGFQYEVGKEYTHDGPVHLCSSGFHFCGFPLDVLTYYPAGKFAEVEADEVSPQESNDSKRVARKLKIVAELSLHNLCQLAAKFILDKVDFSNTPATNTGNRSAATNTGNRSAATNTGYRSAATNTGDQSAATNTGDRSAATNTGDRSAATNTGDQSAATNTGDQSAATNTGYRSAATNTGDQSAATNTGNQSAATNTGNRSAATNTGDQSAATNTGNEGCAISLGIEGKASGAKGCWLTLAEWQEKGGTWHRVDVQTAQVDGKKIKADVFYVLQKGKFVEVED